jgi:putative acetyltransferase
VQVDVIAVRADHVPQVIAVVTEVLAEFGLVFGQGSATDDDLGQLPGSYTERGGAFWVATGDDLVIGTCGVFPQAANTFELRKMYLLPRARGLGLGGRLLDLAIAWTRARGGRRLVLDTADQMARAIDFYEARGFVRDDRYLHGARCTRGYVREL